MAFRGKVQDGARLVFVEQSRQQIEISDVALDENMAWVALQAGQILQVTGIGQLVEIKNRLIALGEPVQHEIAADEPGTAGYENGHCFL